MLPLAGGCTVSEPAPAANDSGTNRWFSLNAWVTELSAIKETFAICAASGVVTENAVPYVSVAGADEMTGRAPRKRYGGEKISAFCWSFGSGCERPFCRPPPATSTVASGSNSAVE